MWMTMGWAEKSLITIVITYILLFITGICEVESSDAAVGVIRDELDIFLYRPTDSIYKSEDNILYYLFSSTAAVAVHNITSGKY